LAQSPSRSINLDPVRVLVIDGRVVDRGQITRWIDTDLDFAVVGSFRDCRTALLHFNACRPNVVVFDAENQDVPNWLSLLQEIERFQVSLITTSPLPQKYLPDEKASHVIASREYVPKSARHAASSSSQEFPQLLLSKIRALSSGQTERVDCSEPVRPSLESNLEKRVI
jgi:chemotaxis response regulator CheB